MDTSRVTRFEVIDHIGRTKDERVHVDYPEPGIKRRIVVMYGVKVELSLQDDGRTLKVFITDKES